jgi:two-component system competent response regulator ComA
MIKILLIDDHLAVAQGTKVLIEQEPEYHVTICSTPSELFLLIKDESFDILLIDINMPEINGLELSKEILTLYPLSRIIIYTGFDISFHINLITEIKVSGFISKTASREQIINTIECVLSGNTIIPLDIFWKLRCDTFMYDTSDKENALNNITLNEREQNILVAVSNGYTNREISELLLISQRSVEYALTNIFNKLNVKSRTEALMKIKTYNLLVGLTPKV